MPGILQGRTTDAGTTLVLTPSIRALQRRLGITAILVTHDQVEAMTMSDRIAVMSNGGIAQLGNPYDVYDKPSSEFTFKFLGHANVIDGSIEQRAGRSAVIRDGCNPVAECPKGPRCLERAKGFEG